MNLSTYIQKNGDTYCAKLFNVTRRTIASWRRAERVPRPEKAIEIVAATKGKIDVSGMYGREGAFLRKSKRREI